MARLSMCHSHKSAIIGVPLKLVHMLFYVTDHSMNCLAYGLKIHSLLQRRAFMVITPGRIQVSKLQYGNIGNSTNYCRALNFKCHAVLPANILGRTLAMKVRAKGGNANYVNQQIGCQNNLLSHSDQDVSLAKVYE